MSVDEKRGYAKGYAAGRRRLKFDLDRDVVRGLREQFIQQMMLSIAPEMIARPWGKTTDGKFEPHTGAVAIMRSIRAVAEEAARNCDFATAAFTNSPSTGDQS